MLASLRRLFRGPRRAERPLSIVRLPDDQAVVYAAGDIHGCLAQLKALEARIFEAERGSGRNTTIIHLGDMIDRGPDSAAVLDSLIAAPPPGFRRICIMGNHEAAMLRFLDDPRDAAWLENGGMETLRSYEVAVPPRVTSRRQVRALALEALASIPAEHVDFLKGLPIAAMDSQHFYVHAGIRPGIELERQSVRDLLEIRAVADDGIAPSHIVVHGHTPVRAPELHPHRIAVDTGCYATGRLSAIRLDGRDQAFLSVTN